MVLSFASRPAHVYFMPKVIKNIIVTSLVGFEPTTFELEVQCANPLRHRDLDGGGVTENLYISCILLVLLRLSEFSCYMLQWMVLHSGILPKEELICLL